MPRSSSRDVPRVDDRASGHAGLVDAPAADQKAGDLVHRPLRGRKSDPHRRPCAERFQPFQRERQVRAALVADQGVNLVDDHRLDRAQQLPALVRSEQQVQRLGRGHQHDAAGGGASPVAGRPACRRCAPSRGSAAAHARPPRPARQFPQAALPDCDECRCSRPSAATRRPRTSVRPACRRASVARGRRGKPKTPTASCQTRSAPRSKCSAAPRFPATHAAAARSVDQTAPKTNRRSGDERSSDPYVYHRGPNHLRADPPRIPGGTRCHSRVAGENSNWARHLHDASAIRFDFRSRLRPQQPLVVGNHLLRHPWRDQRPNSGGSKVT